MEIKSCPFCGNSTAVRVVDANEVDFIKPEDERYEKNPYYQVVCCMNEDSPVPIADWKQGCGAAGGFRQTKEEAISAWNHRASPWVSTKERLPNEREAVLAVTPWGDWRMAWKDWGWWYECGTDKPEDISHWMPLPEPPED